MSASLLFSFELIYIIGLVVLDQEGRCSPNRVSYGHLIQVPSTSCSPCRICFCSASRTTEGEPAWSAGGRLPNLSSTEGTHTLCQRLFSCSWLPYPFVLFDEMLMVLMKCWSVAGFDGFDEMLMRWSWWFWWKVEVPMQWSWWNVDDIDPRFGFFNIWFCLKYWWSWWNVEVLQGSMVLMKCWCDGPDGFDERLKCRCNGLDEMLKCWCDGPDEMLKCWCDSLDEILKYWSVEIDCVKCRSAYATVLIKCWSVDCGKVKAKKIS